MGKFKTQFNLAAILVVYTVILSGQDWTYHNTLFPITFWKVQLSIPSIMISANLEDFKRNYKYTGC